MITRPLLTREPAWDVQFGLNGRVLAVHTDHSVYLWRPPPAPAGLAAMSGLTALALGVEPAPGGSVEALSWRAWRRVRQAAAGSDEARGY
jgi:hypothetical protein